MCYKERDRTLITHYERRCEALRHQSRQSDNSPMKGDFSYAHPD